MKHSLRGREKGLQKLLLLGAEWPSVPRAVPLGLSPSPDLCPLLPVAPGWGSRGVCLPNAPEQHEGTQIWAGNKW